MPTFMDHERSRFIAGASAQIEPVLTSVKRKQEGSGVPVCHGFISIKLMEYVDLCIFMFIL